MTAESSRSLPRRCSGFTASAVAALLLATAPAPTKAQRFEISAVGGSVSPAPYDYERVTVVDINGETRRVRASRIHSAAFGANMSIPLSFSDRWRIEGGLLIQPIERRTQYTAQADPDGPFVSSTSAEGTVISYWTALMYRPLLSSRGTLSVLLGPTVMHFVGDAYRYNSDQFGFAHPSVSTGAFLALRGAYFVYRDLAVQAGIDQVAYAFPLGDRPEDFTTPDLVSRQKTPIQGDVRVSVGLLLRFY